MQTKIMPPQHSLENEIFDYSKLINAILQFYIDFI